VYVHHISPINFSQNASLLVKLIKLDLRARVYFIDATLDLIIPTTFVVTIKYKISPGLIFENALVDDHMEEKTHGKMKSYGRETGVIWTGLFWLGSFIIDPDDRQSIVETCRGKSEAFCATEVMHFNQLLQ
jgi:hypothetical protein